MSMRLFIYNSALARNRQGRDLSSYLKSRGHEVKHAYIANRGGYSLAADGELPLRCAPWFDFTILRGPERNAGVIWLAFKTMFHSRLFRPDAVVVINFDALLSAPLLLSQSRTKLIYYALEFSTRPKRIRWESHFLRKHVDCLLDVEETRLKMRLGRAQANLPAMTLWNAPRAKLPMPEGKALIRSLREYGVNANGRKILLYSGSCAPYAILERLVAWTAAHQKDSFLLVLLISGPVSAALMSAINNAPSCVCLLRGVPPDKVLTFVKDASLALLPYCDDSDPNVVYCSPQKLFDCLICGVPFVGSARPLIQTVADGSGAGICTDMLDDKKLLAAVRTILNQPGKASAMGRNGRLAYLAKYNFDFCAARFVDWLEESHLNRQSGRPNQQ